MVGRCEERLPRADEERKEVNNIFSKKWTPSDDEKGLSVEELLNKRRLAWKDYDENEKIKRNCEVDFEREYKYRKGFQHGIIEACRQFFRIQKIGGYAREREVFNIIENWAEVEVNQWRKRLFETGAIQSSPESPKVEHICKVRNRVMARDGSKCVDCGKKQSKDCELEMHHILPVSKGGFAVDENLEMLCYDCHRGEGNQKKKHSK
jgi:5-methylcytosine-specific restriction endonuclease McrA